MKRIKNSNVEKTKALFKQLLLNPNFFKDVKQFRMTHKIPPHGFKTFYGYAKWDKEYKSNEIRAPILQEHIEMMNGEKGEPYIACEKVNNIVTTYWLDLCRILRRHNLSFEWNVYINDYICFNRKQIKVNPFVAYLKRDSYKGVVLGEDIYIKIGATTPSDYFLNNINGYTRWKNYVESLQKLMQGYKEKSLRPARAKTPLQSTVYKKYEAGTPTRDIYNELGEIETIQTVRQLKHRFKKKITPND